VWLDPAIESWSLEGEAGGLTAPVLLIQGGDDPYATLEQVDRIQACAVGPVRRLVPPGGHSPHLEHLDEVVAAIAVFSASLP
jgi:pimeloyl-ACP methyl ester carboxylesterase